MPEIQPQTATRTWPATLALFALVTTYVGGLQIWDRHTPAGRDISNAQIIRVGPARFEPAEGWLLDVARSRSGQSVALFKNGHHFVVKTGRWLGKEEGPLTLQQRLIVRRDRMRVEGEATSFSTDWGLRGSTFSYYGPKTSGRFWQVVDTHAQLVVWVDFYGPNEDGSVTARALADAQQMLGSMDLGAP